MTRMTKSLSLVLIGSALILAGCSAPPPPSVKDGCKDDPEKEKDGQRPTGCTGTTTRTTTRHHHHYRSRGGVFVSPMTPRVTSRFHAPSVSRPSAPAAPSSRAGGFGGTGRGAVS